MSLTVNYSQLKSGQKFFESGVANLRNKALFKALEESGKSGVLIGIRNGIAIVEDSYKKNFNTTTVRKFFGLDNNGDLTQLKDKAIYKRMPTTDDQRLLLGKWEYNHADGTMTIRNTEVAPSGKTCEIDIIKDQNCGNIPESMFYYLPKSNLKFRLTYDFQRGIYRKCIQDNTGKLGATSEYGKLIKNNSGKLEKIKEARVSYNPTLGNLGEPYKYMTIWGRMDTLDDAYKGFFWK